MQTTTNYNMSKPEYSDAADIAPISGNMDTIDTALHKARTRDADLYDETATYNVGDYCIYADTLYRCTGNAVTGTWDLTKWQATTIAEAFEPKHTWELFETITADGTDRFTYTSALPENISGIIINCEVQAAAAAQTLSLGVTFDGTTWLNAGAVSNAIATGIRYSRFYYTADGDLWKNTSVGPTASSNSSGAVTERYNAIVIGGTVKQARVYAPTNEVIPSGSTFEIYIRR